MATSTLILFFFLLCGLGALLGIIVPDRRSPALLACFGSLASILLFWFSLQVMCSGQTFRCDLWTINPLGSMVLSIDSLSALFLCVVAVVVLAVSVFSASYLKRYIGHYSLRALNAWYLLLFASIVLILIAGDVLLFLLAWEAMSILSYLLVNFEHERPESSRASYLMLAMSEAGFMAVVLVFLFLSSKAGSLEFSAIKIAGASLGPVARWFVFFLTFFGFGIKAGLVPINTWLPRAHPAAPANVSAILSGVILNLGLYGIIRVNFDLLPVTMIGAGVIVLIVGTISALVGILYATTENDLKTVLAHSSIENIGIITVGLGAGLIFSIYGRMEAAGIAFIAAFYHLINHSIYKSLLFLGAGEVDNCAGTRDLNKLGGLIHMMPWTAGAFLVGTLAISALPPFNGFVSEWLTLQTMLRSAELSPIAVKIVFALCGAGLALTAALAVTCFVKVFAMGFLGMPRSKQAASAVEGKTSSIVAMVFLAVLCFLLGVLPTYIIPALNRQIQPLTHTDATTALVPPFFSSNPAHQELPAAFIGEFHDLGAQVGESVLPGRGLVVMHRGGKANPVIFAMSTSYMFVMLIVLLVLTYIIIRLWLTHSQKLERRLPWDGGLRRLLPEMTYTATGFSNPVRVIFDAVFQPTTIEDTQKTVAEHFRTAIRRQRTEVHIMDRVVLRPAKYAAMGLAHRLAGMHHGRLNAYTAYVLSALLLVLVMLLFQSSW